MGAEPAPGQPTVVVWRDYWLARSETFIRDQVAELQRWTPRRVGWRRLPHPLVEPDYAPYGPGLADRIASRWRRSPSVRRRLAALIDDPAVGLVHAHFGPDGISALPFARIAGKPLVVTFHGVDVTAWPARPGPAGWYNRRRLIQLFGQAERLIAVSEFVAERLRALGAPPEKIRVHHIGTVVLPAVRPEDGARAGIVFVGRLVAKKGVADLLEAVRLLPAPLNATPVTIAGYGPLLRRLRRRARRLGVQATFVGAVTSAEAEQLLARSAIFCGPSRTAPDGDAEGFGMVFLEAAQAGLPVVAYQHGGVGEAVADGVTGRLVPEGDVTALSGALADLLSDPERARAMGEQGRDRVRRSFDVRTQTRLLELVYDEVRPS